MRVGVIGGGAWGTALAQVSAGGGETLLWAREPEVVESVNGAHENRLFLPSVPLDPAIRASIFEPFHRAPRDHPGAPASVGLGLLVVRTLSEAQGAQVNVESVPGRGTTFVVRVPRAEARLI